MLKNMKTIDKEKKLPIVSELVLVSVSIFSNVPDYDEKPIFVCNEKPRKRTDEFIQTILRISLRAKSNIQDKLANILEFLDKYVNNIQKDDVRFKTKWSF